MIGAKPTRVERRVLPDGTEQLFVYFASHRRLAEYFSDGGLWIVRGTEADCRSWRKKADGSSRGWAPPQSGWRIDGLKAIDEKNYWMLVKHLDEGRRKVRLRILPNARRLRSQVLVRPSDWTVEFRTPPLYSEEALCFLLERRILDGLAKKAGYLRRLDESSETRRAPDRRFSWQGRSLTVELGSRETEVRGDVLYLAVSKSAGEATVERALTAFLQAHALSYIAPIHEAAVRQTGLEANELRIGRARGSWGRCRMPERRITYSCFLAQQSPAFVRAVVLHELCHLRELNHGPRFWRLVLSFCPDYHEIMRSRRAADGA